MSDRIIGMCLGLAFFLAGFVYREIWARRRVKWVRATGTVIGAGSQTDNGWRTFEYVVAGSRYTATASTNGNIGEIGSEVDIYYDADRPEKADIDSGVHNFIFTYLFMIVGAAVIFISYYDLWD